MKNKASFIARLKSPKFNQFIIAILLFFGCSSAVRSQIIAVNTSYVMNLSGKQSVKMVGIENITPIGSFSVHKGLVSGDPTIWKMDITPTGYHHAYLANQCAPMIGIDYISNPKMNESGQRSFCMIKCGMKFSTERFVGGIEYGVQPSSSHQQFLTFRLGYVIGLTHDCLRKRIHNNYMNRFMEF